MKSTRNRQLLLGIFLLATFAAVMVAVFQPLFADGNALNHLDNLFNSISKGSAYYIPKVAHEVEKHGPEQLTVNLKFKDPAVGATAVRLLERAGAKAAVEDGVLVVSGDVEQIFSNCLADADSGYHNRSEDFAARYGVDARVVLHAWWRTLGAMEKDLNRQKRFDAAQLTHTVQAKAVECAYNYYGIAPENIEDRWVTVVVSLIFYVLYTIWYGYGVMYLFEGLGFKLAAH